MKSPFEFQQHGQCGKHVSSIFPKLSQHVDKMAFIHSGHTESNNHSPALFMMNSGLPRMGHPCVGSWMTYGLGSESDSLPAFVAMSDPKGRGLPKGHAANWGAGFLPSVYQGTHFRPTGEPLDTLKRPKEMNATQRRSINFILRPIPLSRIFGRALRASNWLTESKAPHLRPWRWTKNRPAFARCMG